tara:strand:- start:3533 stop:5926 length:2394 start_codon:yes stop_codon:yes gene_type:complete
MKNNLLVFFFICIFFFNKAHADLFKFETSELKLLENGNIIDARNGKAISSDNDIEINAEKYIYQNDIKFLRAYNGTALIKSDNIKIKFKDLKIDQENSIFTTNNFTQIIDLKRGLSLETSFITYNKKIRTIESKNKSILRDNNNNFLDMEYFYYEIDKNILKVKDLVFKDKENNLSNIKIAFINTKTNKLLGKDIEIDLNNKSFNEGNDPRLLGKKLVYDNENGLSNISKGIFTTCKKTDKCPPWQISAEEIQHNKKKKIINYKNALLRIYDVPVFYFPKFFHPDPTVKRKSGFLIPSIQSSSTSGTYLHLPYYQVVAGNKDFTISPRIFAEDKFLLQTEYRQVNFKSDSIFDFSLFNEKNKNSKNHFFYNLNQDLNFNYFDTSKLKLRVERTSNDTYLRANKIKSKIVRNDNVLENSLNLNLFSEDFSIETDFKIYEDLNKKKSDRYEFILPKIFLSKKIKNKTSLDGNFLFQSNNLIKNYQTNIFEKINTNDLIFTSNSNIFKNAFYNNYKFILRNTNSSAEKSLKYKNNENYYLSGMFQYDSSLPLIKENNNFQNILTPKISLRISPNHTKKETDDSSRRIDINNIYGLKRLQSSNEDTLEGGSSITIGKEYSRVNKETLNENFVFKLANNIRLKENKDLPAHNQMGLKNSNFFGEIQYNPNEFLTTKYNFSLKNSLDDFTYENLEANLNLYNFTTSFEYLNENDILDKKSYFLTKLKYRFDDFNNINFSKRENNEKDLTEYYKLIYEYKNDCLSASLEYNKNFYDDRDIRPEENIFLKLTIMPFGQIARTPDF